jgi:folate-dependent tRNA-U54 methylase TrmFO/GidA
VTEQPIVNDIINATDRNEYTHGERANVKHHREVRWKAQELAFVPSKAIVVVTTGGEYTYRNFPNEEIQK